MDIAVLGRPLNVSGNIDWKAIELHGVLSELAYESIGDVVEKTSAIGFDHAEEFSDGSMFGFLAHSKYGNVLSFRGSGSEFSDWIANFDIRRSDTTGGFVHRGFFDAYNGLKPSILSALSKAHSVPLWITGHSLGGALAAICAYELSCDSHSISGLITYGQPRFASQRLAREVKRRLKSRYLRIVNEKDMVPTAPPFIADGNRSIYCHHCGSLLWFRNGKIKRNSMWGSIWRAATPRMTDKEFERIHRDPRDSNEYCNSGLPKASLPMIDDHYMSRYLKAIREHST